MSSSPTSGWVASACGSKSSKTIHSQWTRTHGTRVRNLVASGVPADNTSQFWRRLCHPLGTSSAQGVAPVANWRHTRQQFLGRLTHQQGVVRRVQSEQSAQPRSHAVGRGWHHQSKCWSRCYKPTCWFFRGRRAEWFGGAAMGKYPSERARPEVSRPSTGSRGGLVRTVCCPVKHADPFAGRRRIGAHPGGSSGASGGRSRASCTGDGQNRCGGSPP